MKTSTKISRYIFGYQHNYKSLDIIRSTKVKIEMVFENRRFAIKIGIKPINRAGASSEKFIGPFNRFKDKLSLDMESH